MKEETAMTRIQSNAFVLHETWKTSFLLIVL